MNNDNEFALRMKFYMAPKDTPYEKLLEMNKKYTSYPGLTLEQAKQISNQLKEFQKTL